MPTQSTRTIGLIYTELCIDNIGGSWAEVTQLCMDGVWRKLWPGCFNDLKGFEDVLTVKKVILGVANNAGF